MRPVNDPVTAPYGMPGPHWAAGYHTGIDYGSPTGTPCHAATFGAVMYAGTGGGWGDAYGRHVVIEWPDGPTRYRCLYAHLSSTAVAYGEHVEAGQVIGHTGATGNVTGPHLHFEVRTSPFTYGSDVDPAIAVTEPEEDEMNSEDWKKLRQIVADEVEDGWQKHMTVTRPDGTDDDKRREQVVRETWQEVKREL